MLAVILRFGLCIALLGSIVASRPSHSASAKPPHRASAVSAAPRTAVSPPVADTADASVSAYESSDPLDAIFEFVFIGLLSLLVFIVVGSFIGGFAAVSIFMDSGCLRSIVFCLGWGAAGIGGLLLGMLLSEMIGLDSLFDASVYLGVLGYPFGWIKARDHLQELPRDQFLTWKRTLTSGAVVGTGAGSALSMLRSVALFKGGGGSFGGGGASGSFGGTSAGSGGAVAAKAGSASAGEAVALAGAGGTTAAADSPSRSNESKPETDAGARSESQSSASWFQRQFEKVAHLIRHLRWYHGCAFVLVVLIFMPVGLGIATWFQNRDVVIIVTAAAVLVGVYRLFRRWAVSTAPSSSRPSHTRSTFRGGGASDSWQ